MVSLSINGSKAPLAKGKLGNVKGGEIRLAANKLDFEAKASPADARAAFFKKSRRSFMIIFHKANRFVNSTLLMKYESILILYTLQLLSLPTHFYTYVVHPF